MSALLVLHFSVLIFLLLVIGWFLFSLGAGIIIFLSTATTDHVSMEPKTLTEAESKSVMNAHTKDQRIMDPLNEAKDRWYKNRDAQTFTDVSIKSRDGLILIGCYWKAETGDSGRTVVLVHGMMDSSAGMGYLAEEYHSRGWNVLSVDLRAHGESEGTKRTMGVREAEDLGLWIQELIERFFPTALFLHGVSMGGATVLLYAGRAKKIPGQVKGIIVDSSYARYDESFERLIYMAVRNHFISWSITCGASIASAVCCGVSFNEMKPIKQLRRIALPALFFHGQKDVLVPIRMVREMFEEAVKRGNELVVIPEAPHIGPYFYAPVLYMQKIEEFCRRNL